MVTNASGHLACPFCDSYEVERLYLASLHMDSCACSACGARWDEVKGSGLYAGHGSRATVFSRRP